LLHIGTAEPLRMVTCTQLSLIDPLEVHVEVPPVHVAEPVLTPIGTYKHISSIILTYFIIIFLSSNY